MATLEACVARHLPPCDTEATDTALAAILALLRERTGADFAGYRRTTMLRRVRNRMISVGATTLEGYARLLAEQPGEPAHLLQRLTIKVSRFYRNAAAFDRLGGEVLPALARAAGGRALRLWSAGCGCGEEPYTLAMLLQSLDLPGTVLATDLDESALFRARQAVYAPESAAELPPALQRYLEPVAGGLRVAEAARARVEFARHDLTSARLPPAAAGFDLVSCRNVVIYFERPLQQQVFDLLYGAVVPGGALFLGEAEWPPLSWDARLKLLCRGSRLFQVRPLQTRVFQTREVVE